MNDHTPGTCIRHRWWRPVGRMQYAPNLPAGGPSGTRQTWQASLTPRKVSNKLFQGFRGLGKCQTSCFKESEASERLKQVVSRNPRPRKGSNKLFQGFRGLGKAQTSCFKVSDASGRLRTPAKPVGYIKSPYPANFAGVRRHPSGRFSRTESRTITLNPRFYGRLH